MRVGFLSVVCVLACGVSPLFAQGYERLLTGATVGAVWVDGGPEPSFIGMALYRFTPSVAFGVELVRHPSHPPPVGNFVATDAAGREFTTVYSNPSGRSVTWSATMRIDASRGLGRVVPFAVAGAGIDNTSQNYAATTEQTGGPVLPGLRPPPLDSVGRNVFGLQAMGGGGVSLMTTPRLSIDLEVRYLYYHELPDRGAARIGAGVAYRF